MCVCVYACLCVCVCVCLSVCLFCPLCLTLCVRLSVRLSPQDVADTQQDSGDLMECLVQNKHQKEMNEKCAVGVTHFQLVSQGAAPIQRVRL